jgi:hypothetical protein
MAGFSAAQAIIAAIITPALLILASGSLIATALVRLARVVDRVPKLSEAPGVCVAPVDLLRHERRALLTERAIALYFWAVVCFVVVGFTIAIDHFAGDRLTWLRVIITTFGMCLIEAGSGLMVRECRLATAQIQSEIKSLIANGSRT